MLSLCMTNTILVLLTHSSMAQMFFGTHEDSVNSGLPISFLFIAKTRHTVERLEGGAF